ncbi:MAG: hypothetical protein KDA44_06710 [Planctomycetales bacterium]|nr:hypothetical protein [Planctomycetales bacterium]
MWLAAAIAGFATYHGFRSLREAYGLPLLVSVATIAFWYLGDVLYNDQDGRYESLFKNGINGDAWFEVAIFLNSLVFAAPRIHRWANRTLLSRSSRVFDLVDGGADHPGLQRMLPTFLALCSTIWLTIIVIALIRLGGDAVHFVFPVFGQKMSPFGRSRVGSGISALLSLGHYLQVLAATGFGLVWALSTNRSQRTMALVGMATTWPYFIFDRTRHGTLMVCLPTVLAYVFVRMRGPHWRKVFVLCVALLITDSWFRIVMEARTAQMSVLDYAFSSQPAETDDRKRPSGGRHEGLNMFEELCWVNKYIRDGSYQVNWGERYFAELVNPVPRALWPGKPLIGMDYAIARGMAQTGKRYSAADGGVNASISTGIVGQGVVNFGRVLGPIAAALIMAGWIAFLARLDLQGELAGRLPLYALGIVSIFNMGRDITLLLLYPLLFGYLFLRLFYDRRQAT